MKNDEYIETYVINEDGKDVFDLLEYNIEESDQDSNFINKALNKAISIKEETVLKCLGKSNAFLMFLNSLKPTQVFDISMSKDASEAYKKGEYLLKMRNDGTGFLPTLVNKEGTFVAQVRLNPKNVTPELASSMNTLAVQQQLGQILDKLEEMNNNLQIIEQGQRNDRIALFYSAKQQYIEAMNLESIELKQQALISVAKSANDARFQLMETMKTDIDSLLEAEDHALLKNISKSQVAKVENIRKAFKHVNDATGVCAYAYAELGENKSLLVSLNCYKDFIEKNLLSDRNGKNICQVLQQWDKDANDMWINKPQEVYVKLNTLSINPRKNLPFIESLKIVNYE